MIEKNWTAIVVVLSGLLLVFLCWKEWSRSNTSLRLWRLLASVLAVVSLAFIAILFTYSSTQKNAGLTEVVLLTPGYDRDKVNEYLRAANKNVSVYSLNADAKNELAIKAKVLGDIALLDKREPIAIQLFGEGLGEEELDSLNNTPLVFHAAEPRSGITSISWQKQINQGSKLTIQGSFNNAIASKATITLVGFDTRFDSVTIPANSSQPFELTTVPKHAGNALYSLEARAKNEPIANEPLPVKVLSAKPLKVLMLSASPDFENKFLKNWLSQSGYQLALRFTISKNKYAYEFINLNNLGLNNLTAAVLDKFDVLVADAVELKTMNRQELNAIQNQVIQKGLGLIIKADSSFSSNAFYSGYFKIEAPTAQNEQQVALLLKDSAVHLPDLAIEQPLFISSKPGTRVLVATRQQKSVVSMALAGAGKVVVSTVGNTFQWVLAGKSEAYQTYWSALLNEAGRQQTTLETWSTQQTLPTVNSPVKVHLQTSSNIVPYGLSGETKVFLTQNERLPFLWQGSWWPTQNGWQSFIKTNGETDDVYVFDKNDYNLLHSLKKTTATQRYARLHPLNNTAVKTVPIKKQLPTALFVIIVLLSLTFLWVEKKFL